MKRHITTLLPVLLFSGMLSAQVTPLPNIIVIICDDLNSYIEGYETSPQILTPNLYELEQKGVVFLNANVPSPKCGPSRTSIIVGKDADYTKVYDNTTYNCVFRDNFSVEDGNSEIWTIPQWLKDSVGYYTYEVGKIMHCYEAYTDVDTANHDLCSRALSWNDAYVNSGDPIIEEIGDSLSVGFNGMDFAPINDSLITYMEDHRDVDQAISFIDDFATYGTDITCGRPFFLGLGIKNPHTPIYIPESFWPEYFQESIWTVPYEYPYNRPYNAYPYNGVVMPPQPDPWWVDYDSLGYMGKLFAVPATHNQILKYTDDMPYFPEIDPGLSDDERAEILRESLRANTVIAYMASIQYFDYELGRFFDDLESHPEIYNNTIVIFTSDNGFSLGQKEHWGKYALWETDMRIPFIYVDLRNPVHAECTKPVSTLDIFPTLCDAIGVPEPTFLDGTRYLDGVSLLPLINNPSMQWNKPSLGIVRQKAAGGKVYDGSCFSQYSVRDNRFHLIQYHTNNTPPTLSCNEAHSQTEMELYDIGVNRQTDPNEWNNLIDDPAYAPVVNYLEQFLPTGTLYKQQPYTANIIETTAPPCLLKSTAKLKMRGDLYDLNGTLLTGAAASAYTYTWTNNLTAAVVTGKNYTFNMATIPLATFSSSDRILFYLTITETATGKIMAFTTKTYYFNNATKPSISFNLSTDNVALTATVVDYNVTGTYTNSVWDFGDGTVLDQDLPATHTYAAHGLYYVKNTIYYGNGPACTVVKQKPAHLELREGITDIDYAIYPNPAENQLIIAVEKPMTDARIELINMLGEVVFSEGVDNAATYSIDVSGIAAGEYMIKVSSHDFTITDVIVIQH